VIRRYRQIDQHAGRMTRQVHCKSHELQMLLWLDVSKHTRFIAQNVEEGLQEKQRSELLQRCQTSWRRNGHGYRERIILNDQNFI
jgi:hypothetical protein